MDSMNVIKRDGRVEEVSFDKVLERIKKLSEGLHVNATSVAQKVLSQIYDGVKTTELDELASQIAANLSTMHPDYGTLAARLIISNHQKNTSEKFSDVITQLSNQIVPKTGEKVSYISDELQEIVKAHGPTIDSYIDYNRDFLFDYFGFKTLERAYLIKSTTGKVLERPQHMWMRVALALWGSTDLQRAFKTYDMMSLKMFTHATPTLFNAGTPRQQMSSCFVEGTKVYTLQGVKNIEDVCIGDEVITHTGSIKKVSQLHKNPLENRSVYDIKIAGTPIISVTENHRLMSISTEQEEWGQKPQWNRVDYLRKGDWIAIPKKNGGEDYILDIKTVLDNITSDGNTIKYTYEYDDEKVYPYFNYTLNKKRAGIVNCKKKGGSFNRYWKFDYEMMELLGIWYGDGSITNETNAKMDRIAKNINIVSYHNNTNLIEFVKEMFYKKFGVEHVTVSKSKYNMVAIVINNTIIAQAFKQIFKCGFDGKRLPLFMNTLSYEHIRYFLAGLVSSDGCVSNNHSITICLTNPPLVNDIFHLARSVGIPLTLTFMSSASHKDTGRIGVPYNIVNGLIKKYYEDNRLLNIDHTYKGWSMYRMIDGISYLRLNDKIVSDKKPEYVYTLGIEDDHSYSVGGIIAENCFLLSMSDDSINGIYKTLGDCALISKYAGGIGLHVHNIRAKGSLIRGTNGTGNGLPPLLRVYNNTARYVDQGGGRRNGSFAIYLEPWHADVEDFLRLKLNTGAEEDRARDLFYALWIPDLFMKRVEEDGNWTLFCPDEAPGLADVYGDEFETLYTRYEAEGRGRRTISAQKLWFQILDTQMETGTPYLLYKDAANKKSNQKNLGTIKSSNLCTEVIQYTDKNETAVCNLASMGLPSFIEPDGTFNYTKLRTATNQVIHNLNRVIDINFYPVPEAQRSNMRHRPVGLGVQGLADVFALCKLAWDSPEAADLNARIFEHMYYAAVEASVQIAIEQGPYETFEGSPASQGLLQPDLWGVTPCTEKDGSLDWKSLRTKVRIHGMRNSLLLAPMPTASTSQILGYNECIEPITSNIYTRRTLAGEYIMVNKYLLHDLMDLGVWSDQMKQMIVANNGSVQGIPGISEEIQSRYRTAWELKQKTLIDLAADRGAFVCQSQSLNLFVADATYSKLTSMHFYAWRKGLKTGCYYLRTKASVTAQKFTVDPRLQQSMQNQTPIVKEEPEQKKRAERRALADKLAREYEEELAKAKKEADDGTGCLMCSS